MSSDSSNNSRVDDDDDDELWNAEDEDSEVDLLDYALTNNTAALQEALQNGADVECNSADGYDTPLIAACSKGYDPIVRILLDAGADARCRDSEDRSAMIAAVAEGHLSIVEMLHNHDNGLQENTDESGWTPLFHAISWQKFEVAHFLLDRGANALATDNEGETTLTLACHEGVDLAFVRRLLAAGVDVEARDASCQFTALHHAALDCSEEIVRELIVEHNADLFAVNKDGDTPFDLVEPSDSASGTYALFIECYVNKLTQEHGRLALHTILGAAKYAFAEVRQFHPPQNPWQIRIPLGELTLQHFRMLLQSLDAELIATATKVESYRFT